MKRHLSGWKPDRPDHRDKLFLVDAPPLPSKEDLDPFLPPVLDQGSLGSCTCNATAEALEYCEGRATQDELYSRLYLYWYTRSYEGTSPSEDSGAQIRSAVHIAMTRGAPLESEWPYVVSQFSVQPPASLDPEAGLHKALLAFRIPTLTMLKCSIAQQFPVVFGFSVPANMESAECAVSGLIHYPQPNEAIVGGHAVLAVGFDDSLQIGDEVGAVKLRNSWGPEWGDGGNGYLPYRFFREGLATDMWTIRRQGAAPAGSNTHAPLVS